MLRFGTYLLLSVSCFLFMACEEETVPKRYAPKNNHEAYWYALQEANLGNTAMAKEWNSSAEEVFQGAIKVQLPYKEAFHLDPREPRAQGYRFSLKRGQKAQVQLFSLDNDSSLLFIDAFRVVSDSLQEFVKIASADSMHVLAFEPRHDAEYILRFQPELLRGGRYEITLRKVPSLLFPVTGKGKRAIQSFFGDPRDAGRREHHGVDIFAKKRTPVIAPSRSYVRFVGERKLGGKVVWLRDVERYQNLYFAHLDSQWVKSGGYVNAGDTIGTVGNTGNAKFTPSHLHFGIYKDGPIDPFYFIVDEKKEPTPIKASLASLGKLLQTKSTTLLRASRGRKSLVIDTLENVQAVNIQAVVGSSYRVLTREGDLGYVSTSQLAN